MPAFLRNTHTHTQCIENSLLSNQSTHNHSLCVLEHVQACVHHKPICEMQYMRDISVWGPESTVQEELCAWRLDSRCWKAATCYANARWKGILTYAIWMKYAMCLQSNQHILCPSKIICVSLHCHWASFIWLSLHLPLNINSTFSLKRLFCFQQWSDQHFCYFYFWTWHWPRKNKIRVDYWSLQTLCVAPNRRPSSHHTKQNWNMQM